VFVPGRVVLTLLAAQPARGAAHLEHLAKHLLVRSRAPRANRSGNGANVRAIEIQTNALAKILNLILSEARIRARNAHLGARITLFNAIDERVIDVALHIPMRADHFPGLHGRLLQCGCITITRCGPGQFRAFRAAMSCP
jgi:hypothetical protein